MVDDAALPATAGSKFEEDPPPDDLEKRIRIGCGALFGIIPGLWLAIGILGLRAGWRWACVAAVAAMFAYFSLRYGYRFWFGVLQFLRRAPQRGCGYRKRCAS